jgi:hypothetical protein
LIQNFLARNLFAELKVFAFQAGNSTQVGLLAHKLFPNRLINQAPNRSSISSHLERYNKQVVNSSLITAKRQSKISIKILCRAQQCLGTFFYSSIYIGGEKKSIIFISTIAWPRRRPHNNLHSKKGQIIKITLELFRIFIKDSVRSDFLSSRIYLKFFSLC